MAHHARTVLAAALLPACMLITPVPCYAGPAETPPADGSPLGGPEVPETDQRPTLVQRGYDGRIKPLTVREEIAAFERLKLEEEARAGVDERIAAYTAAFDEFVITHIPELMSVETWLKTGQWPRVIVLIDELRVAITDATGRAGLRAAIADALPEGPRARFRALLDEYESARVAEAKADAERAGEAFEPIAYRVGRRVEQLQLELEAAFERVIASGRLFADQYLERAKLSPESEARVRDVFARFTMLLDGKEPTPDQLGRLVRELMQAVEPHERGRALRALNENNTD